MTQRKILGFDLGTNSIGWATVQQNFILKTSKLPNKEPAEQIDRFKKKAIHNSYSIYKNYFHKSAVYKIKAI